MFAKDYVKNWPIATDLNVRNDLKNHSYEQILEIQNSLTLPYAVAAINVNGDLNLGTIMRSAVLFTAERFLLFGNKRFDRRSTVGAQNYIAFDKIECDIVENEVDQSIFYNTLKEYDYIPVFIETNGKDINYVDWKTIHRPCLVFGNEGYGISQKFIGDNQIVSIPQRGVMRSLNVASAASIACYLVSQSLS